MSFDTQAIGTTFGKLSDRSQYKNINELHEASITMAAYNFDTMTPLPDLRAIEHGENADKFSLLERASLFGSETMSQPLDASPKAFRQAMTMLRAGNGAKYLHDTIMPNFPGSAAQQINLMLNNPRFTNTKGGKERNLFTRSRAADGDREAHIRGFLSDSYVPVDAHKIIGVIAKYLNNLASEQGAGEMVATAMQRHGSGTTVTVDTPTPNGGIGHNLLSPYMTPDRLSAKIRLGLTITLRNGDTFSPGFLVKTEDTGGVSIHVLGGAIRLTCLNGMWRWASQSANSAMYKELGWSPIIQHRWGSENTILMRVEQATAYALMSGVELLEKVEQANLRNLPNTTDILAGMIKRLVPKDDQEQVLMQAAIGTEGERTAMGVVNGITYAAHSNGISQDLRDKLEIAGGAALEQVDFIGNVSDTQLMNQFFRVAGSKLVHEDAELV
ncbi:MAG: hypothetical protein DRI46_07995 [Chloroflexi bacterium]|nr:MAG: hypothetical protein DRI46_07995 [Chloroflexota bacterium]